MTPLSIALGGIILAGGRSSRMGEPKMLLPWGETSIIGHLLQQWQNLGAEQITVVCAIGDTAISSELDRVGFSKTQRIWNPEPERGMFSSIQCAASWKGWRPELTHWAIILGDQPHLRLETLKALLEFSEARRDKVCQPRKNGHRHHPVVLPKQSFERLVNTTASHLKDFLESYEPMYCEMTDPGLDLDIDRPEDYQKALEMRNR